MKHLKSILFLLLIGLTTTYAQKIHSPFEIIQIMTDSKVKYGVNALKEPIECPDYSEKLNYHDTYRVETETHVYSYKYEINEKAKPLLEKAEECFTARDMTGALEYYHKTLEADPTQHYVMTYIGQIYDKYRDYEQSIDWYKKAIEANYADYMAHWFLADAYFAINDYDKAVDEIVIARIMNRNNPRIKTSMDLILKKAKKSTVDWYFNPQIRLGRDADNDVMVEMGDNWTMYAMAKALWNYEPGYKESMGVKPDSYTMLEEQECLIAQLIGMENAKTKVKKDPQLNILKKVAKAKMLDEYILYEIFLPRSPSVVHQLSKPTILSIKDYVLNVRQAKI